MGIETALIITSMAMSAKAASDSAKASREAGAASQRLSNYNAQLANQQAKDTERDGKIMADSQRNKNDKMASRQRALYGKSGVIGSTGSPLLVQAEQAGEMEMAALEIEVSAKNKSAQLQSQGAMDRQAGINANRAGQLNSKATLMSGAASVVSMGSKLPDSMARYKAAKAPAKT